MKGTLSSSEAHLLLLTLSFSFSTLAQSVCYFPNERSADFSEEYGSAYEPCPNYSNDGVSMCCALNRTNTPGGDPSDGLTRDTCLPNGLCMNSQNSGKGITYWRDLCTSTDWSDKGKCLNVCTESDTGTTPQLTPCDGTENSRTWCCGSNNTKCCNTSSAIVIPAIFGASSSSTPTANPTSSSSGSSGLSTGAKAGIGVGAGVGGLLVISALAVLFLRSWKNKKSEGNSQYTLTANTDTACGDSSPRGPPPELESNAVHEVSAGGHEPKHDLNYNATYELPGNTTSARGI